MTNTLASERRGYVDHYWEHGYAVVRGVFPKDEMKAAQAEAQRIYAEGLKHYATYRHKNLLFEVVPESYAGEWAFRDGVSVPLGDEPVLCKYEQLFEKPGPFYIDDKWYE